MEIKKLLDMTIPYVDENIRILLRDSWVRIAELEAQLKEREWITWQKAEAEYKFPCAFLATDGKNVEKIYWDKLPMPGWVTHCMKLPSPPKDKESYLPPKDWDEFETDAMLSTMKKMKKGKYNEPAS